SAAWADVRGNLDRRLRVEGMRPDQDPDYERMRDARMQALKLVDLQALSSEQRARRKRDKAAEKVTEKAAGKSERSTRREARHASGS
ncbi:MAG: asparagine synthase, partial [Microbacterium sp.]